MDFGRNVVFKGGFSIWKKDYAFNLIFQEKAIDTLVGGNNFEVYFETEDINNLYQRLVKKVKVIHSIIEHPWGQRAFRVRDPDDHIFEFAETMESVVKRLKMQVLGLEEIAKKSMMPLEFIKIALMKQLDIKLMAPCGINCGACIAFFGYTMSGKKRKHKCNGCWSRERLCAFIKKNVKNCLINKSNIALNVLIFHVKSYQS